MQYWARRMMEMANNHTVSQLLCEQGWEEMVSGQYFQTAVEERSIKGDSRGHLTRET